MKESRRNLFELTKIFRPILRETPPHGALRLTAFSPSLRLILRASHRLQSRKFTLFPEAEVSANWGRWRRGATLLARENYFNNYKVRARIYYRWRVHGFNIAQVRKKGRKKGAPQGAPDTFIKILPPHSQTFCFRQSCGNFSATLIFAAVCFYSSPCARTDTRRRRRRRTAGCRKRDRALPRRRPPNFGTRRTRPD